MKVTLITMFPSITFDTKKWRYGARVRDGRAVSRFTFGQATLVSYRGLVRDKKLVRPAQLDVIREERKRCIDGAGNLLEDFALSIEPGVEIHGTGVPNTDAQQLLTYFAYEHHIDYSVDIDTIKIISFPRAGRHVYYNHRDEVSSWCPAHSYLLPIEQSHKSSVKLRRHHELVLVKVLEQMSGREPLRYRRVLTSLTLFNESCRASRYSDNAAVVLMVSALESLLQLPRLSRRETFVYGLKALLGFDDRVGEWADQLYELRSQIVHGDITPEEVLMAGRDRHYPHLKIARNMYSDCLWLSLANYGHAVVDPMYKVRAVGEIRQHVVSNKEKLQELLRQKSKLTFKAFRAKPKLYQEFIVSLERLTMTDYSGAGTVKRVLSLILAVMEPWAAEEKAACSKPQTDSRIAHHYARQAATLDEVLQELRRAPNVKDSLKGKFELSDLIRRVVELARQLEPVVHDQSEFRFTPGEFLHRSLQALSGTY